MFHNHGRSCRSVVDLLLLQVIIETRASDETLIVDWLKSVGS